MSVVGSARRFFGSSSGIAVAMAVMNFATYGFVIVAAPILGPGDYGAVAASLNVLLVISVGALGLQATAARRISAAPAHVAQIERSILRVTYRASLAIGLLLAVLSPLVAGVLRIDSHLAALLIALSAVPLTIYGGQLGVLQGERRWGPLGLMYMTNGLGRLIIGAGCLILEPTYLSSMVAITISFWLPIFLGAWLLRHDRAAAEPIAEHRARPLLGESMRNGIALLAFFGLSSLDIVVARNFLSDHDAGLYAAGLILSKAMLFLPQFIVVVAFPSMSTGAERRRAMTLSLALITALGVLGTTASWLASGLALRFVGGHEYAEVQDKLWMFAILGTLLSMIQLLVYSVLARQGHLATYAVWVALFAMLGLGAVADSLSKLVAVVIGIDTTLLVVLLAVSLVVLRGDAASTNEDQPDPLPST